MKKLILVAIFFSLITQSNAQHWSSTGIGVSNSTADYTCVYSMINFNGDLYIGGCFTSVNGVPANYIARFDGLNWTALGDGLWHTGNSTVTYTGIRTMTVFNGELYVAGIINQSGTTPIHNVAKWNGSAWIAVGNLSAAASGVLSICVYNNELYAGGNIWGLNSIAKWNGSAWIPLGQGMKDSSGTQGLIRDMRVYNNLLYIGGQFAQGDSVYSRNLIAWDGSNFISVGTGVNGIYGVTKLGTFQSDLIVAGGFTDIDGIPLNEIGGLNSNSWYAFGSGIGNPVNASTAFDAQPILEHNGKMIVGGFFTTAGSITVNSIAEWDGTNWNPLDSGITGHVASLCNYNDDLYAAGHFTSAGGIPVSNIAKWTSSITAVQEVTHDILSIFPNPTQRLINITIQGKSSIKNISLQDSFGKVVFKSDAGYTNTIQLNLENYSPGIYFVKIESDLGVFVHKIIKE